VLKSISSIGLPLLIVLGVLRKNVWSSPGEPSRFSQTMSKLFHCPTMLCIRAEPMLSLSESARSDTVKPRETGNGSIREVREVP
jgi:hypothetical protein